MITKGKGIGKQCKIEHICSKSVWVIRVVGGKAVGNTFLKRKSSVELLTVVYEGQSHLLGLEERLLEAEREITRLKTIFKLLDLH